MKNLIFSTLLLFTFNIAFSQCYETIYTPPVIIEEYEDIVIKPAYTEVKVIQPEQLIAKTKKVLLTPSYTIYEMNNGKYCPKEIEVVYEFIAYFEVIPAKTETIYHHSLIKTVIKKTVVKEAKVEMVLTKCN